MEDLCGHQIRDFLPAGVSRWRGEMGTGGTASYHTIDSELTSDAIIGSTPRSSSVRANDCPLLRVSLDVGNCHTCMPTKVANPQYLALLWNLDVV